MDRTAHTQARPSPQPLAPRPNKVMGEPATVQACQQDYEAGADVRQTLAAQEARRH